MSDPTWYFLSRAFLVILLAYGGFGVFLYLSQSRLLYFPDMSDPETCRLFEKSGVEKRREGDTLLYYKENGKNLVVFYHGNGGKACDRLFLAQFLDEQKVSYLFVEYAGYGDARKPAKELLEQNVRETDAFLRTLSFEKLTYLGESLGTALAAYHAVLRPPERMILVTPYTAISAVAAGHFPYTLYPVSFLLKDNFTTQSLGEYKNRLLIIHGVFDEIIPVAQSEGIYRTAPAADKKLLLVKEAGHNNLYDFPEVWETLADYLR